MTLKPDTSTTRRRFLRTTGVTLTGLGTVGLATTSASAQSGSQGVLADGLADGGDTTAFFRGFAGRYSSGYASPEDLETLTDRARNEFNANADLWVSYGNWLLETQDVRPLGNGTVAVEFDITRGRWPLSEYDPVQTTIDAAFDDENEEFTGLEWHTEEADDPDFQIRLENRAAEQAADELQAFRRDYIGEDADGHEIPDDEYLSELAGEYADMIGLGADSQSVLELLLGEVDI